MYFKSLTINNLFSYYGDCVFDLTPPNNSEKNVVVILGRNGAGKTSFLNSVKLLFAGLSEDIRRTVQRKRTPSANQYVCGIENEWWGIMNRQARSEATNEFGCGVKAVWESDDGEVSAERVWTIDYKNGRYDEQITVSTPFLGVLTEQQAEDYLEQCLPKSYIPFFFFDGEDVQALAEANDNEVIAKMEQLLNIRPLENMQQRLKELAGDWNKEAMAAEKQRELITQENIQRSKESELAVIKQNQQEFDDEIAEIKDELNKLNIKLRLLRGSPDQNSEIHIKAEIKQKEELRHQKMQEISEAFQRDAFLMLTPDLMGAAFKQTEVLNQNEQGSQQELLSCLKQELPEIFTKPPYPNPRLDVKQSEFYSARIIKVLDSYDVTANIEAIYHLDGTRLRQLHQLLSSFQNLHKPHRELQKALSVAHTLKQDVRALDQQLKDAGDMSNKQRLEFELLLEQEEALKNKLINLEVENRGLAKQESAIHNELQRVEKEIARLQGNVSYAETMQKKIEFTKNLRAALNEVKERLKREKRAELEESYNRHLKQLLDSNNLIDKVVINEGFEISYLDDQGNTIGMSTVSAGMKQLSSTALLWSLKEISARDLPLIFDTPMGRIDRKHQDNLLQAYYPKVGRQVIILPTDSELDERKYALLEPYIFREYHLSNPQGKETQIEKVL